MNKSEDNRCSCRFGEIEVLRAYNRLDRRWNPARMVRNRSHRFEGKNGRKVKRKEDKTVQLLRHLEMISKRLGLFFGKDYCWKSLRIYLLGMTAEARVVNNNKESCEQCDSMEFAEIVHDVMSRVQTDIEFGRIKEENAPEEFFEYLWNKVSRECPEMVQQFI